MADTNVVITGNGTEQALTAMNINVNEASRDFFIKLTAPLDSLDITKTMNSLDKTETMNSLNITYTFSPFLISVTLNN